MAKIVVLGLDGLSPELVSEWAADLPNLTKMQSDGIWGNLQSTIPPTTPTAAICAQVGRNPGAFGVWDYYYRDSFAYNKPKLVNSTSIKADPLYRILPKMAQKVAIINVPGTWPPPVIPGGYAISSPILPDPDSGFTHPETFKGEIQQLVGEYFNDASISKMSSGNMDEDKVLNCIRDIDSQRLALLRHFVTEKGCDYVFTVIRGIDRMAHLFYRFCDEKHVHYEPNPKYADVLKEHYKFVDEAIGELRAHLPYHSALLVFSIYSAERLDGRININEWLIQEGYLNLSEYPSKPTPLSNCRVDWSKTKVWAAGAMGQIYINLKDREAQGVVDPDNYNNLIDELTGKLATLTDGRGNKLKTQVFRRADIYFGPCAKYGPDIFASFNDYHWNTNENVGYEKGKLYSYEIGKQRDDASHSLNGYFCMAGPDVPQKGEISGVSLINIAPTVLDLMGVDIPYEMEGESILAIAQEEIGATYYQKHEEVIKTRLEALGY